MWYENLSLNEYGVVVIAMAFTAWLVIHSWVWAIGYHRVMPSKRWVSMYQWVSAVATVGFVLALGASGLAAVLKAAGIPMLNPGWMVLMPFGIIITAAALFVQGTMRYRQEGVKAAFFLKR